MVAPNTKRNMALNLLINYFDHTPRRVLALMSAACVGLLLFGLYLQEVVGLVTGVVVSVVGVVVSLTGVVVSVVGVVVSGVVVGGTAFGPIPPRAATI